MGKAKKYIWDSPKERQVSHLNHLFTKTRYSVDKGMYRMIKNVFQSDSGVTLDDLEPKARQKLIEKVFFFKFEHSCCNNAKYVRVKRKKKGYENVEFLLGENYFLIRNLKKKRPDLIEKGLKIIEKFIENKMDKKYGLTMHRLGGNGSNYDWNNIDFLPKKEHDELTKQERANAKEKDLQQVK